jgi:hypothetical protein
MKKVFLHFCEDVIALAYLIRKFALGKSPEALAFFIMRTKARNPNTFNKKILYKMAHDRREVLSVYADKLAVRDYVSRKIGARYLTTLFGNFGQSEQIDLSELPRNFVLKPNHSSGAALIVGDFLPEKDRGPIFSTRVFRKYYIHPSNLDQKSVSKLIKFWRSRSYYKYHRIGYPEWAYKNIKPSVFAEELLLENGFPPQDYRFFIFNGTCEVIMVDTPGYTGVTRDLFSKKWEKLDIRFAYPNSSIVRLKPVNLEEMITVAEKLADELDHVRVDLYNIEGRIVFGEITNYHAGGSQKFYPKNFDFDLGKNWKPDLLY